MQLKDFPGEVLEIIVSNLDYPATLNFSLASPQMFRMVKHQRSVILAPYLLRAAGLDPDNAIKSLDLVPGTKSLDSGLLKSSMQRFGYLTVLLVYDQLQFISRQPLEKNPRYVGAARELLQSWRKFVFEYCGALGYFCSLPELYHQATHGGTNGITYYPENALKVLRCIYAIRYLLENKYEEQSSLRHMLRKVDSGDSELDIVGKDQKSAVIIREDKFAALEAEIVEYLPLDGKLKKYQSMKQLKLNLKDEAFEELKELELVQAETPNPFKY